VNQRLTSPVREICTLGSVGAGRGRLPPATQWVRRKPYLYRDPILPVQSTVHFTMLAEAP
ncbi:MAG: hypothetical protein WBQ94_24715, partial [Terracidiphilus sp.]